MRKLSFIIVLALFSLLLASNSQAIEQVWYVSYGVAIKAIDKAEYAKAEEILRDLIVEKRIPEANAPTYGMWITDYTPYYYLGKALIGQSQFDEAHQAFRASLVWGTIKSDPEKLGYVENVLGKKR